MSKESNKPDANMEPETITTAIPKGRHIIASVTVAIGKTFLVLLSIAASILIVLGLGLTVGTISGRIQGKTGDVAIMDKFDMFMTNEISTALEDVITIEKVYWLSDSDQVAPKPNENQFGFTQNPQDLEVVLKRARPLIGSRELLFNVDRPFWITEGITYYQDETILVITWKET